MKPKLLVTTEIDSIDDLRAKLDAHFEVVYVPNISSNDFRAFGDDINAIFTNPNNSRVYYGAENLEKLKSLKVLATASTGTIHIDKGYLKNKAIELISITKSISVLERITSTAEHAFLLTLSALRNYDAAVSSVQEGLWDYSPFVGRQMNSLKIGVIGYGRLGKMYAKFCKAFDAQVICCDPFKQSEITGSGYESESISEIFKTCDVVSLHIHAIPENLKLINSELLTNSNPNQVLINTSRGEIVDEGAILAKAKSCQNFKYFTDVLSNEHEDLSDNLLFASDLYGTQVVITPHCGGMTSDARAIAYHHAADLLIQAYH